MRGLTPLPAPLRSFEPDVLIATGFGLGRFPLAPGTWASLATLPLGIAGAHLAGAGGVLLLAILATLAGLWTSGRVEARAGAPDPSFIVIDEVAGQLIALIPAGLHAPAIGAAFLAFRLFDILKPFPANLADRRLPGGWGIMVDDLIAGAYAGALVWGLQFWAML